MWSFFEKRVIPSLQTSKYEHVEEEKKNSVEITHILERKITLEFSPLISISNRSKF